MSLDAFEEECRAAGLPGLARTDSRGRLSPHVHLTDPVGDFGDFQDGVDFGSDALEFTSAVERGDPLAEVVEGQSVLSGCDARL